MRYKEFNASKVLEDCISLFWKNGYSSCSINRIVDRYFGNMRASYLQVLRHAVEKGEIKHPKKLDEYADFLVGIIFGISVLYKVKSRDELQAYIDDQLSMIV
ncbi:hypothetical protein [Aureitalea marina]|nr:hypothetical protein [Aureitalea marina]